MKALRASPAAALADRDAQLDDRESKLADREAQLAQKEAQLGARERALLPAIEQERIEEERAQLGKDRFQVLAWMQLQGQIEWPLPPRSIDETPLLIDEHLDEVVALAQLGREQCDKGRQLPEQGGIGLLFKLKARLKHTSEELSPLIRDVAWPAWLPIYPWTEAPRPWRFCSTSFPRSWHPTSSMWWVRA